MYTRVLLMLVLLLSAGAALAEPLRPNTGLWWEEPVTGRFYAVSIAPSGRTFVVISEFDEQGRPRWQAMRGSLQLSSEIEQRAGAPLAEFHADLLDIDGACRTCPVTAPDVRPSPLGQASIVFTDHATGEFRQGAIRRPMRFFAPADQPEDFPENRLGGEYVAEARLQTERRLGRLKLEPAQQPACTQYEGAAPPAGALRLAAGCEGTVCAGDFLGQLGTNLEIHVGRGQQPELRAYRRGLARTEHPPVCIPIAGIPSYILYCTCPTGTVTTPGAGCTSPAHHVCTETHRLSEQDGRITAFPLHQDQPAFVFYQGLR